MFALVGAEELKDDEGHEEHDRSECIRLDSRSDDSEARFSLVGRHRLLPCDAEAAMKRLMRSRSTGQILCL